jgi:hypothetical protein
VGHALVIGLGSAFRRWPLVIILWAAGVLFALAFSLISGQWLAWALNASLASRSLLKDLNVNVLTDLWVYHRESLAMLGIVGLVLVIAYVSFSIWLNAGVVRSVQDVDAPGTLSEFWRRGLVLYPLFARLWVLATVVEVAALVAVGLGGRLAIRWLAEVPHEMARYYALGGALLLAGGLLLFLVTIHDHARIYAVRKRVGALRAYGWAAWFVARGDVRAVPLALVLVLLGAAAWLVYQTVAMLMPATSSLGITVSLLWGQLLLQARAVLRVATFAAHTELQAELLE